MGCVEPAGFEFIGKMKKARALFDNGARIARRINGL
jgi:hypothetical protein